MRWIWLFCLGELLLLSCHTRKSEYYKEVKVWMDREIMIPQMSMKYKGQDTVCIGWEHKKYKILRYVDSLGCTPCKLQLSEWGEYLKSLDSLPEEVFFIFVLGMKDFEEFEYVQRIDHFEYPVFYDDQLAWNALNHFPEKAGLQVFLLDENNRVVAIGDPVRNNAVRKLYRDIIQGEEKK